MNVKCCVHVLHNVYQACCGVLLLDPGAQNFKRITKEKTHKASFLCAWIWHIRKTASGTSCLIYTLNIAKVEKTHQFVLCPVPAFVPIT